MSAATGRFVWHDLMTTNAGAALEFYTRLLGWTTRAIDMGPMGTYTMIHAGGKAIGGIVPFDPAHGIPSHWISYVTVGDVDETCRIVPEAGGKVCVPPMDIPNVGRFAVIEDGQGAVLSPFKGNQEMPEEEGVPPLGCFVWDELLTSDIEKARDFYAKVFGWTYQQKDMGPAGVYTLAMRGDKFAGGMMQHPQPGRPAWLSYIHVEDIAASTAWAKTLGAQVFVPPTDIPGVGQFSLLSDPTGAMVALFKGAAH